MVRTLFLLVTTAAIACSSSSTASKCGDISGNYAVHTTRKAGTCAAAIDGDGQSNISMVRGADGTWTAALPGIDGGCPGELDAACKFVSVCKFIGKDGASIGTLSVDYTFDGARFSGSSVIALLPPAVETPCNVSYVETGEKL